LKSADGGILFLDEIGELGVDEQAMLLRALEEKKFYPMGSDIEDESDFQLLAGTNRDLRKRVEKGKFREDLFARINIWTFAMPSLSDRREDIEPNIDYEIDKYARDNNILVRFNKEARQQYLKFALSPEASWKNNFRDLNASINRMATLAGGGRLTSEIVEEEIERLKYFWRSEEFDKSSVLIEELIGDKIEEIDMFDRMQIAEVVKVCRSSKNLSEAGRKLFSVSREQKKNVNDSDRIRKYLNKFGLSWKEIHG
jgi:transcriptional regulatory protein RtcR